MHKDPSLPRISNAPSLLLHFSLMAAKADVYVSTLQGTGAEEPERRKMDFGDRWKPNFFTDMSTS